METVKKAAPLPFAPYAFVMLCALLLTPCVAAQDRCETVCVNAAGDNICKIERADYNPARQRIELRLGRTITPQDLKTAPRESWVLVDIMEASVERPVHVAREPERSDPRPADAPEPFATLFLHLDQPLTPKHQYRLFQSRMQFQGCPIEAPLETAVAVPNRAPSAGTPPAGTAGSKAGTTNFFSKSASEGREDSNVYLSGNIEGATGSKTQFSTDIKLDVPFASTGLFDEIGPLFNLKASTAEGADANSLNLMAKLRHSHNISRKADPTTHEFIGEDTRLLTGLVYDLMPGIEADRRFRNVNAVVANRLYFLPRVSGGTNLTYFQPFIGYETGRNLRSPIREADDITISRPLFGGSLYVDLFPKRFKGASLQVDYVRRFLLRREVRVTDDDDGKEIPLTVGKGPRDYVKATFGFDFSDFTGVNINYEYGSLPPNFELVKNKFSFGLVYKFKTKIASK